VAVIYGKRIRFRAIDRDDLPAFVKWINDPQVRQGIGIYLPFSQADEEDWFDKTRNRPIEEHNLAIEARQPGERADQPGEQAGLPDEEGWKMIGSCGFFNFDHRNRSSELGIMIGDKSYWNQGYGTEAVRLLLQHGFNTLNLNRIYLRVFANNLRAIHIYEKAGFVHEVRQRQAEFRDGQYIDLLVMSILRDEFK
jgi:RimJ/RimL family protein N-acetyltransferase